MHCRATSYHHIFSDLTALDRTDQLEKNIQLACIIFFNLAKHAVVYLYLPCGVMLNSHTLSTETHWIVSITTMSCVLDCSQVSVLQSQNLWNVHSKALLFDLRFFFLPKPQFSNEKNWCLETKLWSKAIFSQHVQRYAEISAWFVHVTDCYYSAGKRNSNS